MTACLIMIASAAMLATILMLMTGGMMHGQVIVLNALPYLAILLIGIVANRETVSTGVALLGTIGMAVLGMSVLVNRLYLYPDPQGGLVFMLLPWFLWACCGLTVGIMLLMLFVKWLVWPTRKASSKT